MTPRRARLVRRQRLQQIPVARHRHRRRQRVDLVVHRQIGQRARDARLHLSALSVEFGARQERLQPAR